MSTFTFGGMETGISAAPRRSGKRTLVVTTPVGLFTRKTGTLYTRIVVWNSPRARQTLQDETMRWGVGARWFKDRGYGVTWHTSQAAAEKAARRYQWDSDATLIGVYAVDLPV